MPSTKEIVAEIYKNLAIARANFAETREILRRIPKPMGHT